jgi:hypothetical protein
MNPVVFLVVFSLAMIVLRFRQPWVRTPTGPDVRRYPIPFQVRLRLQRANVYGLGALLLLGSIGGWMPPIIFLAVVFFTIAVMAIPLNYVLTERGIATGRSNPRPWRDFRNVQELPKRARLLGQDDTRMDVWLPGSDRSNQALLTDLRRMVHRGIVDAPIPPQRPGKQEPVRTRSERNGDKLWKGQEA